MESTDQQLLENLSYWIQGSKLGHYNEIPCFSSHGSYKGDSSSRDTLFSQLSLSIHKESVCNVNQKVEMSEKSAPKIALHQHG